MLKIVLFVVWVATLAGCGRTVCEDFVGVEASRPAFQDEFGFAPPAEIKGLNVRVLQQGDVFVRWLQFAYDKATVDGILKKGWRLAAPSQLDAGSVWSQAVVFDSPNQPPWWPSDGLRKSLPIYYTDQDHESGARHYSIIIINATAGVVYCKSSIWQ